MSDRITNTIAEVLRVDGWTCEYHEPVGAGECSQCDDSHRVTVEHTLAALKAQRIAVVELPEADETDDDGQIWFDDYSIRLDTTGIEPARIITDFGMGTEFRTELSTLGARRFALALLAAAEAGESK